MYYCNLVTPVVRHNVIDQYMPQAKVLKKTDNQTVNHDEMVFWVNPWPEPSHIRTPIFPTHRQSLPLVRVWMLSYQKQLSALGWLQPETTLPQGPPTKMRLAKLPASFLIQLNTLHLSSALRENMSAEFLESWWWWVFLRVQDPFHLSFSTTGSVSFLHSPLTQSDFQN